jgi:hypothetical protein
MGAVIMSADLYSSGRDAAAAARAAFGGRGSYRAVRRRMPDGTWLGPARAVDLAVLGLTLVPYAFGEPLEERRQRLAALPAGGPGIVPAPIGEPQGLDTLDFFAACRLARPEAHLVADLELLGHKLGQLCLSFGADEIMGSIVERRELRLGPRASSKELTRKEAEQMLVAAGFEPRERSPEEREG